MKYIYIKESVHKIMDSWVIKFLLILTTFITDILTPLFPISKYLFLLSIIGFTFLLVVPYFKVYSKFSFISARKKNLTYSAAAFVVVFGFMSLLHNTEEYRNGVISEKIPSIEKFQESMGFINVKVDTVIKELYEAQENIVHILVNTDTLKGKSDTIIDILKSNKITPSIFDISEAIFNWGEDSKMTLKYDNKSLNSIENLKITLYLRYEDYYDMIEIGTFSSVLKGGDNTIRTINLPGLPYKKIPKDIVITANYFTTGSELFSFIQFRAKDPYIGMFGSGNIYSYQLETTWLKHYKENLPEVQLNHKHKELANEVKQHRIDSLSQIKNIKSTASTYLYYFQNRDLNSLLEVCTPSMALFIEENKQNIGYVGLQVNKLIYYDSSQAVLELLFTKDGIIDFMNMQTMRITQYDTTSILMPFGTDPFIMKMKKVNDVWLLDY